MGGTNGAEGPRQHLGQQEMGLGAPGRQGYTVVHTDSEFGSGSSLPSNASGAASVQSSRGQSLPQGLGREGLGEKLTAGGGLAQQVPLRTSNSSDLHAVGQLHARLHRMADKSHHWAPMWRPSLVQQDPPCTADAVAAGSM